MAKRASKSVNKSQKVRDILTEKGIDTSNKVIMDALKSQGITIGAAQVSNVKAAVRAKQGMNGARQRGSASGDQAILNAFRFVRSVGGLAAARKALDEVAALR